MFKPLTIAVVMGVLSGQGLQAFDCCDSYTDVLGEYHKVELCLDYCCWTIGVAYKGCCSNIFRMIPTPTNETVECVHHWFKENEWWLKWASTLILIGTVWCLSSCFGCFIRILSHIFRHLRQQLL
ncbi:uncharacterized protein LOC123559039 [Mercenaria mercenaria]|uniref:uncharacterized protein LOC123559039 n=1 Tax=Mercenaria mercenaria TaxID=6596 RepID=UPI00234EE16A|nr:uncharacterized protein LOC123559039 [Mercenaria mercenaria]